MRDTCLHTLAAGRRTGIPTVARTGLALLTALFVTLAVALHAPAALAAGDAPAVRAAADSSARGRPPARVLDRSGFNFTTEMLGQKAARPVELQLLVDSSGLAREVRVARGGTPFDSAAVDAVRWWWFQPVPGAAATWTPLSVDVQPPSDTDPIVPDVIALAHDAESRGDLRGAIDAWSGVLARVGVHASLGDEWSVRERILRLAARLPEPLAVPSAADGRARGARNLMQRNIARAENCDYAKRLDDALAMAPWYADAYRWRAAARAACGQRAGALRDAMCYRIAARDSASRALADRAVALIAAGDTLTANSILKH